MLCYGSCLSTSRPHCSMVYVLGASVLGGPSGYYASVAWGSVTIAYFLVSCSSVPLCTVHDIRVHVYSYMLLSE